MEFSKLLSLVLSILLVVWITSCMSVHPFFFVCQYHTRSDQNNPSQNEASLSVSIKGNPDHYNPSDEYEVLVTSSTDFDGFFVTGLYTLPNAISRPQPTFPNFNPPMYALGTGLLCSVVHSHLSPAPHKHLSFKWTAPPAGTGCVDFLATATLSQEIMFKDVLVLQICEKGAAEVASNLITSGIHRDGFIFREDFDYSDQLDYSLWNEMMGGNISDSCGPVASERAAVFCNQDKRVLITRQLNMSTASVLQFTLSSGSCAFGITDPPVSVYLGADNCTTWMWLESFVPDPNGAVHLTYIPLIGKTEKTCLKWEQHHRTYFNGCWAIDNILLVSEAARQQFLKEDFDPTDASQWLFYPGASVQRKCQSDGNALVFGHHQAFKNYASTTDISPTFESILEDVFLEENFDTDLNKRWLVKGGNISQKCGVLHHKKAFVFDGIGVQRLCSPYLDASNIKTLRFFVKNCAYEHGYNFTRDYLTIFAELSNGIIYYLEKQLTMQTKISRMVSLVVPRAAQVLKTRFCWQHHKHLPHQNNVWAIDTIQMLPWQPKETNHVIQFKINLQCGKDSEESSFKVEFSNDQGHSWHDLHVLCLPGLCKGSDHHMKSHFTESELERWERVTMPLPYPALSGYLRMRFVQTSKYSRHSWAMDNVYIGECPMGCNGHGLCMEKKCICDLGFRGEFCNITVLENPAFLSETFSTSNIHENSNILQVKGAELGFKCGILGSGRAVIFDKEGFRSIITRDLNTSRAKYLEFTVVLGSGPDSAHCPMSNYGANVFVHFSCNGGVSWHLLKHLESTAHEPRHVTVDLPGSARQPSCRFRIWQPKHSGRNRDVWAIDDIVVANTLMDSLYIDFSDAAAANKSLKVSSGKIVKYCKRPHVLRFFENGILAHSSLHFVETRPLNVGPSSMLQFDLVMACGTASLPSTDNKIHLEFSTNNGLVWKLVQKPCTGVSEDGVCNNMYSQGTVYEASELNSWKRITISLPKLTWSSATSFRFRPCATSSWALDNLYIGQQCPDLCSGHGYCVKGLCRCDDGFFGVTCVPRNKLKSAIKSSFDSKKQIGDFHMLGGSVVKWYDLGSLSSSGSAAFFYQNGVRQLMTNDLDTSDTEFLQFFIKLGNLSSNNANKVDSRNRRSSVVIQYSNDGGISWHLLKAVKESFSINPELQYIELPPEAKTNSTRVRWWQPHHAGKEKEQWVIDEILIGKWSQQNSLCFSCNDTLLDGQQLWSSSSKYVLSEYCGSSKQVMLFDETEQWKFVTTFPLNLKKGDVIQFKINPGCPSTFSVQAPIFVEYSHDFGFSWTLMQHYCHRSDVNCANNYKESSIYYNDPANIWETFSFVLGNDIVYKEVMFRWMQNSSGFSELNRFALDRVYIGEACPNMCSGHGICWNKHCECDPGYTGMACYPEKPMVANMVDNFNDEPSEMWEKISGGYLSLGCGILSSGKTLYFGGSGTRYAITKDINTSSIRLIQFIVKIGSKISLKTCQKPSSPKDNVVVQYSTNGGITWQMLKELDYKDFSEKAQSVYVLLPDNAKTSMTRFKFWQPLNDPPGQRAEWAIDDLFIAANDSTKLGFQDNFDSGLSSNWYTIQGGAIKKSNHGIFKKALKFEDNQLQPRYAETWDFHVAFPAFLQFDIYLVSVSNLELLYSLDMGQSWKAVIEPCMHLDNLCHDYELGTKYSSQQYSNWSRISLQLPSHTSSYATRFRWIQQSTKSEYSSWALDNVYLGNGCAWFCSGHGYCRNNKCICDKGFTGDVCVPENPLPCELRDSFDDGSLKTTKWAEVSGADIGLQCGTLISGSALYFYKDDVRLLTTQDLDTSNIQYLQFTLSYGCHLSLSSVEPTPTVIIIQYSVNAGITWQLLKEFYFQHRTAPTFYSVPLIDGRLKSNATRFRFWQPNYFDRQQSDWAIDDIFISGLAFNPNMLYDTFEDGFLQDAWFSWPNGKLGTLCPQDEPQSIVFEPGEGVHGAFTRDIDATEDSVIQFDIKVGCENRLEELYPVRLEYSTDLGLIWSLVKKGWTSLSNEDTTFHMIDMPTVYYNTRFAKWRRIVIPLSEAYISRSIRFRWYQGVFPINEIPDRWALDNVYIGPACDDHCSGHGYCISGHYCQCDPGYQGDTCDLVGNNALNFLKEEFEDGSLHADHWESWIGGKVSHSCGVLFSGSALVFQGNKLRALTTENFDMTLVRTVNFHLRLGCQTTLLDQSHHEPVLFQYSVNGGIEWHTISKFAFLGSLNKVKYYSILLPDDAHTFSTKLRWWQPCGDAAVTAVWAIDQISFGVIVAGAATLNDEPLLPEATAWGLVAGSEYDYVCGSSTKMMQFTGENYQFAMTADTDVLQGSFIQFELSMGCGDGISCYAVELQYSFDLGKTWSIIYGNCSPIDETCSDHDPTVYSSVAYSIKRRVTVLLPSQMWSRMTRFRWIQNIPQLIHQSWALGLVHIGSDCPELCNGHGTCSRSTCICDVGWAGIHCDRSNHDLPSRLIDTFETPLPSPHWFQVIGGVTSELCGLVASGLSLHFYGDCDCLLVTTHLDLKETSFVQFYLRFGCVTGLLTVDGSLVLQYSRNNGISWKTIQRFHPELFLIPRLVTINLPQNAMTNGVQLRWRQLPHTGKTAIDWAIDNVVIAEVGSPKHLHNEFNNSGDWLFHNNINMINYCGSTKDVAMGTTPPFGTSLLETADFAVDDGYILQFQLAVACNGSQNLPTFPVVLEYSIDLGRTWSLFSINCTTANQLSTCKDGALPSVYYGPMLWRRIVLPLPKSHTSHVRFRWQQQAVNSGQFQNWAVTDVYVGEACSSLCTGHGTCSSNLECVCDEGYFGSSCQYSHSNPTYLKDEFSEETTNTANWMLVLGGSNVKPCVELADGKAVVFSGPNIHLLETIDLDLRNAKFVQFLLLTCCADQNLCNLSSTAEGALSIYLQFSTNAGISWETLREYSVANLIMHQEYVLLPESALSCRTRFRWHKAAPVATTLSQLAPWALDNIFIGGFAINPAYLQESFTNMSNSAWWFAINGKVSSGSCENEYNNAMTWMSHNNPQQQSITTGELLITENFILQFKIKVGCESGQLKSSCGNKLGIKLEFTKEPGSGDWELVLPKCVPGIKLGVNCAPYQYQDHSIYYTDVHFKWTRVTLLLPEETYSSNTQFRWIQEVASDVGEKTNSWALDDIYVGDRCPEACNGRGDCVQGTCLCDNPLLGPSCQSSKVNPHFIPRTLVEDFENNTDTVWLHTIGGEIGSGCGFVANGYHLYFNGCRRREVVTMEMDTSAARIGTPQKYSSCNVLINSTDDYQRAVVLQYTRNRGITWELIAIHRPQDFLNPLTVMYNIPEQAKAPGIQFRWWQPTHDGAGRDQWAIDHLQINLFNKPNYYGFHNSDTRIPFGI